MFGQTVADADVKREVMGGGEVSGEDDFVFVGISAVTNGLKSDSNGVGEGMAVTDAIAPGGFSAFGGDVDEVDEEFILCGEVGFEDEFGREEGFGMAMDALSMRGLRCHVEK